LWIWHFINIVITPIEMDISRKYCTKVENNNITSQVEIIVIDTIMIAQNKVLVYQTDTFEVAVIFSKLQYQCYTALYKYNRSS